MCLCVCLCVRVVYPRFGSAPCVCLGLGHRLDALRTTTIHSGAAHGLSSFLAAGDRLFDLEEMGKREQQQQQQRVRRKRKGPTTAATGLAKSPGSRKERKRNHQTDRQQVRGTIAHLDRRAGKTEKGRETGRYRTARGRGQRTENRRRRGPTKGYSLTHSLTLSGRLSYCTHSVAGPRRLRDSCQAFREALLSFISRSSSSTLILRILYIL